MILPIVLFLFTITSTLFVGGIKYSIAIIIILLSHEMGHYLMSKRYGITSSLPYFIPLPLPPFGTLGALIRMKGVITSKRALFDIGIAGPLSGFAVALPFIIIGLKLSKIEVVVMGPGYQHLGDPLLFTFLQSVLIGDIPWAFDVVLHPFAYAGWVGLFVTSLNLLPVGQLDGGHIAYALFGEKSRWVYRAVLILLIGLTIYCSLGWIVFTILLLIFGRHHPPPSDTEIEIGFTRKILAGVILAVFILSFIPAPFPEASSAIELIRYIFSLT